VKTEQQKADKGGSIIFMFCRASLGESKSRIKTRETCGMKGDRRNAHKILVMKSARTRKLRKILIQVYQCMREPI
jgi:hypothetical protein